MNSNPPQSRYPRQHTLPEIGPPGQKKLADARVLIVGCGALGSVASELLARAGVGTLKIVDRDLVELSNLQRQFLYDESDATAEIPKAVAAARHLARINSSIAIEPVVADLNAGNVETLSSGVTLILDGTDNVATRYLLNDVAVKSGIPWVYAGCVGVIGRVMPIVPGKTACLRCVFPAPPDAADLPTCDIAGVLGPASAAVGALQAAAAIRLLMGEIVTAGLVTLNAWQLEMRSIPAAAHPQPDCPCCGKGQYPFLSTPGDDFTTTLCGRQAVQVLNRNPRQIDITAAAKKWTHLGDVQTTPWFIRCRLHDPAGIELKLFPDGRLLVAGTTDAMRARSLYARFIGT